MTIGERIKIRREELGMSQEELAKMLGYKSRSSINKIELNGSGLRQTKIKMIADALSTTPSYIMGWDDETDFRPVTQKYIPLLGEVACGQPIFADEQKGVNVSVDSDLKADFCLVAKGDSMINAGIADGDTVFIRQQPLVENGEIAVVLIGDEATLKRVYRSEDNLILQAENPAYLPMVYSGADLETVKILGKAIGVYKDL